MDLTGFVFWVYFQTFAGLCGLTGGAMDLWRGRWLYGAVLAFGGFGLLMGAIGKRRHPEFRVWKKARLQQRADAVVITDNDRYVLQHREPSLSLRQLIREIKGEF